MQPLQCSRTIVLCSAAWERLRYWMDDERGHCVPVDHTGVEAVANLGRQAPEVAAPTPVNGHRSPDSRYDRHRSGTRADSLTYAALDLGTNNCRLLVARPRGRGSASSTRSRESSGSARGWAPAARAPDAAIGRTIEALKVCAAKMAARGVTHARRHRDRSLPRADNCAEFVGRVRRRPDLEIEIISITRRRACLAGCAPLLMAEPRRVLAFDIGGGSTEVGCLELVRQRSVRVAHRVRPIPSRRRGRAGRAPWHRQHLARDLRGDGLKTTRHDGGLRAAAEMARPHRGTSSRCSARQEPSPRLRRASRACRATTAPGSTALVDFATIDRISVMTPRRHGAWPARRHPLHRAERADLVVAGCAILEAIRRALPRRPPPDRRSRSARGHSARPDGGDGRVAGTPGPVQLERAAPQAGRLRTGRRWPSRSPAGEIVEEDAPFPRSAGSQRQLNDPYVAGPSARAIAPAPPSSCGARRPFQLLGPGQRVIDLGAAPGGWAQVAAAKVGLPKEGKGAGDRHRSPAIAPIPGVEFTRDGLPRRGCAGPSSRPCSAAPPMSCISDMAAPATGHKKHRSPEDHRAGRVGPSISPARCWRPAAPSSPRCFRAARKARC